jgi:hypothetical protein
MIAPHNISDAASRKPSAAVDPVKALTPKVSNQ